MYYMFLFLLFYHYNVFRSLRHMCVKGAINKIIIITHNSHILTTLTNNTILEKNSFSFQLLTDLK